LVLKRPQICAEVIEIMINYTSAGRSGKAALLVVAALALPLSGCGKGLVAQGLGGTTVTRVESNELPAPDGQTGSNQTYVYKIGPFDKLIIDADGLMPERRLTVDGSGNITLAITGVVHVADLSLGEASEKIEGQLRQAFVRNPQVAVNLDESVSDFITVDGEVKQPGNYPIASGMTLMRGIAAARGASEFAQLREVVIHRTVEGRQMIALYDLGAIRRGAYADPALYPNDIIVVGDSPGRRLLQQIVTISPLLVSPLVAVLQSRN
jgi:polysaccharide export outer membrane protein